MNSGGTGTDEETTAAEEKFYESKLLAESAMHNLLENDVRYFQHSLASYSYFALAMLAEVITH